MINNYKQITGKYLRANKKRTILTIVGIILSVALISSIGLFFSGLQAEEIDSIKASYGSYHLAFTNPTSSLITKIVNNPKVSRSGYYKVGESIKINDKLSTNVISATGKALELLPFKAKAGRLPEKKSEVAVEGWVLRYLDKDAKIGDEIKINDKEYTLVGVLEDSIGAQIENTGIVLTKDNNMSKEAVTLLVEINSKTNMKKAVQELKGLTSKDGIKENSELLLLEGASGRDSTAESLYIIMSVIISVVLIVTIAVIYNSFQISVVERMKQFGLLRAVGATPRQIRKIVLREATFLACIGVPLGLLCGIIAIYGISISFVLIGGSALNFMKVVISPFIMVLSTVVGIGAVYFSALIPSFFAGRISPLEAISSRSSIKKEKVKGRKGLAIGRLFGFEGMLASKNIKRNRKRYRITVFSIIISVMLFITFKSFTDMTFNMTTPINESRSFSFQVITQNRDGSVDENQTIDKSLIDSIKSLKSIDKIYQTYNYSNLQAVIDKDKQLQKVKDIGGIYKDLNFQGKGSTLLDSYVNIYDKNALEASNKYLEAGSIDIDKINEENGVILINNNKIYDAKTNKSYIGKIADLKVGDEISLQKVDYTKDNNNKFGNGRVKTVKIMAILNTDPFDFNGSTSAMKLITTEDVAKRLLDNPSIGPSGLSIIIKDTKNPETANKALENALKSAPSLSLINLIDQNRMLKSSKLLFQILLYGFVVVVSLIGSVNIINTLTTNIILRRREFATLKAIGLTQKGLRKMIILEGLLYGIVGAIYGSIIGCGLSYLLFNGMNGIREFGWEFPWSAIIIASVCSLLIGYLSVLSPLNRIKKDNLIDSIREE